MYLDRNTFSTKEETLETLFRLWRPAPGPETVLLEQALGRTCAEDIFSRNTLPVRRSAALDGFAVRSADFSEGLPDTSAWVKGADYENADMGDDFGDAFDSVIPVEEVCFSEDGRISFLPEEPFRPGQYVRERGSVVARGERLIRAGTRLAPLHLCLLASGGIASLPVFKMPVVSFLPTGDELVPRGAVPRQGQTVESNSIMIGALLRQWEARPRILPIVKDAPSRIKDALFRALDDSDLVILNGGSSMGSEDFVSRILSGCASWFVHGIKSVPWVPMAAALINGKPVINLPGPSLAAFYGMDWCVRAILARWYGQEAPARRKVRARLLSAVETSPEYDFYVRLVLEPDPCGGDPAARVLSMSDRFSLLAGEANGLLVVPRGRTGFQEGDLAEVELL